MPGHLGHERTTVQNLEIIKIDLTNNILVIKGSVPGPKKSFLVIKESVKQAPKKAAEVLVDYSQTQSEEATNE